MKTQKDDCRPQPLLPEAEHTVNNTTTQIRDLLRTLIKQGIKLGVSQDKLLIEGNWQALSEDVKSRIKSSKQAIIDYLLARKEAKVSLLRARPADATPVLSFAQRRLWFIDQLDGGVSTQYNMPYALRLTGRVDRDALQRSLNQITARHEILRSVYYTLGDGEAGVRTMDAMPVPITIVDLTHLDAAERDRQVRSLALAEARQPFDLGRDLMLRVSLVVLAEHEHVLLFTMHHIASDGWSLGVLTREFATLYDAFSNGMTDPLPPLQFQYGDFACWQRNWLQGDILEQQLDFWLHQLADLPQAHGLPLDFPRPAAQSFEGSSHVHLVDKTLSDRLNALSLAQGATLFMTLQTAFAVLLSRYSNESDIVMGVPIANRTQAELSPLIGFFVNTLILRSDLSGNPSFSALLQKNKQMALQAYDHQQIPFELLVDKLRPERSVSHGALYQIMFVVQNNEQDELRLPELTISQVDPEHVVAKYDIHLGMEEFPDGLQATWTYCSALFSPGTIERMAGHLHTLLRSIVEAPDTPILNLPMLGDAERQQIAIEWNGKVAGNSRDCTVPQRFEGQVLLSPDAAAARCAEAVLSYADLNRKANRLAHCLIEAGVEPGAVVGVHSTRSPELMVALLAIWKCGAAYVPFDPNSTTKRLAVMIEDAGIEVVVAQSALLAKVPVAGIDVLELDDVLAETWLAEYPDINPASRDIEIGPADSAYVIYTSGSTGVPKGVEITHSNLADYCSYALGRYYTEGLAGSLVVTSHAFDITVPSLYLPLLRGGCVELMPPQGELDALASRLTSAQERYLLRMTPLHAQALLNLLAANTRTDTAHVFVIGGASFPPELARELQSRFPNSQLFNHYGPTEATVGCAMFDVTAALDRLGKIVPIGSPMDNTVLYVLNMGQELAPMGVCGELYIGGPGLAKGYLNRPELTAEKFVRNPFGDGRYERLYKSGDLVRWLPEGKLEFLGRCDDQVKIRGFRVELQEIEHHLRRDGRVAQAVLVALEDGDGAKRLVAYVVPAGEFDHEALATQLIAALRHELPDYMVPSNIVVLDELPLSANGKVDRRRLPEPGFSSTQVNRPPETETERRLVTLWSDLLKVSCDNVTTSFFELGGHSLLVTRLISAVNQAFSVHLKIADVFSHSTIRALAGLIDTAIPGSTTPIPRLSRETPPPLSFAQLRLWLIDRLEGSSQYNMPFAFRLRGVLDRQALQRTLDTIVARHEVLRSVYRTRDNGEAFVVVQSACSIPLTEIDLMPLDMAEREEQVRALAAADAMRPFDLGSDLMLRVGLLALAEQEHVLVFNMHHIASDGWSMGVLTAEFATLYGAFSTGGEHRLPALPVQYADFAHWQRHWLQGEVLTRHLEYWLNQLRDLPPVHGLALDFPRSMEQRFAGALHSQRLDKSLSERLQKLSLAQGTTLFMTLQTAFAVLLARYSSETDIVMGTPIANRTQPELSPLIGFFVNTLVLRSDLSGNPSFSDLLQQNKQMALQAYEHQHIPFEMLVDKLQPERSFHQSPLFQIMFTLQSGEQGALTLPGLSMQVLEQEQHTAKFELTLALHESNDGLQMSWEYCSELFQATSISNMADAFVELLTGIVAEPNQPINSLPLVSARTRRLQLEELACIPAEHPEAAFIHELLAFQPESQAEAIADVRLYVLDQERQLLPIGAPGELHIAGNGLARSGSNRPELAAHRVMPNPFSDDPAVPLYRSGDQVRWLPGGKLEYRGKIDSLVRIRGVRIDLREVEVELRACAGVSEAAVIEREIEPNHKQLIAYVSATDGAQLSTTQLRQMLATQLPEYMVPTAFVVLEALPRTPNGKLDRLALPTPDASAMEERTYEAPQGAIETKLATLWQEVVSVPGVGRRDNFFALGGSSLSAVRLEFAIREHFGIELSFRELFEHPELAAQATLIATKERLVELPAIEKVARDGRPLALSFAQQRLWLIDQLTPGGTQYNMPLALHLIGQLDVEALKKSLDAIVARHEVLRTVYAISDSGEPHQCIRELESIPFSITDLRDIPPASRAKRMRELAEAEANKPFDLRQDSMLRLAVLVLGVEEHVLLLTMHHIASDGWSQNVLVEEFVTLYQALQDGKPPTLPSLPVQYADFAHWQRGWLQGEVLDRQLNYWLRQLAALPQVHRVPTDFPRRAVQKFAGSVHDQQFGKSLSEQLQALSVAQGSTLFMTLQTAFAALLARYSGETDIVMGTAIANRAQPQFASLIGFFVNTLVLRSDLSGNPSFTALLRRNRLMALGAFEHQHIPFEMLVDKLQPERSFSHSPLFQIMFTLQSSQDQSKLALPGLRMQVLEAEQHTAKFDLTLAMHDGAEGLRASWEYCTELFCPQTIANIADGFAQLLAAVVAEPECPIAQLPLLLVGTREQLVALGDARGADDSALPALEASGRPAPVYEAPQGEIETELSALWIELLSVQRVGRHDNFFALGGSSLSAVRLAFAIQERFGIELSVRELFDNAGLASQASLIATKERLAVLPVVSAVVRDGQPLPLSFAQQRLWFIDQLTQGSAQYNMPVALKLEGELHIEVLHEAFSEIVRRHEVLRTVYVTSAKGEASQRILPVDELPLARFDLSGLTREKQETEVLRLADADAVMPYRLDRDLMVRASLITLDPKTHVLLFNMHHIASDGWSMGVLIEELVQLYAAFVRGQSNPLAPLAIQYADFAVWQRSHIQGDYLEDQMNYWQKQLAGIPPVHGLILDRPRALQPSFVGNALSVTLDSVLVRRLNELGHAHGATPFMVLHAAFAVLLGRWSREDDIVVGTPIAGRTRKELAPLIGFFVNNLVLRSRLNTEQSFAEFLRASRVTVLEAYEHQEVPFEMLVDRFCPERNFNHSPLFQILFSLQDHTRTDMSLPGLQVSGIAREQSLAKFELSVQVGQGVDGYDVEWSYSTDIFDAETVASLAKHYVLLLQAVVAAPEKPLGQLSVLTENDQRFFAAHAARAVHVSAPAVCLHQRFEQQAARWPDNVALVHEGTRLSYRELNERANRLATYLCRLGVRTGDLVGLFVERSPDMVVSILAVLKAGAAYVPMDTSNPPARTEHILEDSGVSWIISHRHLQSRLPTTTARVLYLGAPEHVQGIAQCSAIDLLPATTAVTSAHAAYVIYTSGSTGKPKGVVVEHRHVVRLFDSSAEHFSFDHNDCWTLFHSYAFDFSVWEIWGALLYGGRLVVVPYAISRSAPDFHQLLKEHRVTVLNQTPSAFYLLIEQAQQAVELDHLRYVVFGGEALDPPRLRPWLTRFGDEQPRLINMYGITETTVHVTYRRIRATDVGLPSSVIGVPLRDLLCHVCNEAMSLQPIGVPGELFVGGGGVSRGYLNRPDLDRERFVNDPFGGTAQRLYRTGDLARWTTAGELEYLGRIDHQAKLRGFRIELGEIEHVLLNSEHVRECVVLLHGDRGGEQQLAAYVVPNVDDDHLPNLLREYLLTVLPPYMVPSTFIVLERVPLTENGKVDRRALLSMTEWRVARAGYVAPTTPMEKLLCEVWQDVLSLEKVGIHDNFFAVGGDSIRVVQIVKRAEAVGIALDVKDIFLHQTIAELAESHRQRGLRACAEPAPLHLLTQSFDPSTFMDATAEDCYPVTAMQQRMLEEHGTHGLEQAVYQPRVIYDIDGIVLDRARLEAALRYLLNKHPVLRTRFHRTESGDHIQVVLKGVAFRLPVLDISHLTAAAQEKAVANLIAQDQPFALGETGIRFTLLVYGPQHYGLFISTHHAIIDGWALVELRNELMALYQELSQERPMLRAPSSGNVFKEHVALEREAQHLPDHQQVWRELMADYRPMPELPSIAADASAGNALALHVDAALVSGLKRLAEQQRVTLKTLLLLAYQRALGQLLMVDAVTVDVVCSGRSPRLSDPLGAIGLFWSLLPICTRLAIDQSDVEAIASTARKLLAMDAHSLFPADSVRKLANAETMTYAAFNYVNFHNTQAGFGKSGEQEMGELKVRYASDRFAYAVKLAISGGDCDIGINGVIEFDRRHFSAEQMLTLRAHFLAHLRQLTASAKTAGNTHKERFAEEAHAEDVHE